MPFLLPRRARLLALAAGPLLLVGASGAPAAAPPSDLFDAGVPFVRAIEVAGGLPQNTVHALLVDREGYLWAGTQDGLARYDGRSWTELELPSRERSNFVRFLYQDSEGALWVATQAAGLLRWFGESWTSYDAASGFPDERVNAVAETAGPAGRRIWAATHSSGLLAWDGRAWRAWTVADGLPGNRVWDLLAVESAAGSRLWLATDGGPAYLELPEGRVVVPAGAPGHSSSSVEALPAAGGGEPEIWVGLYGHGLARYAGGAWTSLDAAEGLASPFVTDLAPRPGRPGELWVATDGGGLSRLVEGRLRTVELGPSFTSRAVYRVLETTSAQGAEAVWVGTRNNGLLRLMTGYWRSFVPFPEIPRSTVSALLVRDDAPGGAELWLGTDGYGLALWRAGRWQRFSRASGALGHDAVQALAETRGLGARRMVWAGTRNGGLSAWDGERWRRHDRASGAALPSDLVQSLLETRDEAGRGTLWVGTREGLASFDGERWRNLAGEADWPTSSVLALLEDRTPEGRLVLWIGTSTGLYRWSGGALDHWGAERGLPNPTVHALHLRAPAGGPRELWIGTDGGGVGLLDPDRSDARVRPLAELGIRQLPNGVVYAIVADRSGRIYLPTNRGVVRLTLAREAGAPPEVELFNVDYGLPSSEASRGATSVDRLGRVWVGSVGGAAALDPASEPADRSPKRIVLRARIADGSKRPVVGGTALAHRDARVLFRYSLLSYFGEPATRYRSQLDGLEAAPTEWTESNEREFANLPAGEFRFRVWGRDAHGLVSGPAELAFTVLPAPWQTIWARLAVLAAALVGVMLLLMARARAHSRRERELEELVATRTTRLQRANALLIELSYVDAVTSIPNRRRFDELLASEWKRAVRAHAPIAVAMVDIDRFKAYNDSLGHPRGDDCLRQVASALADGLSRVGDAICRFGGEEFAVLLPVTDLEGALTVAEHLRSRVEALAEPHPASDAAPVVTVSVGVSAVTPEVGLDPQVLIRAADRALYD
ncbi:MAG: diguanylate cyclase, partial [Thermoanaerobaculia bacterium]